jgi:ParB family chromosome partitioning protein
LKLPETVKAYIQIGKLTAGHARMLIGEPNAEQLAEEIVARGLNVREVEAEARARANKSGKKQTNGRVRPGSAKSADTLAVEKRLTDALGLTVSIDQRRGGGGTLTVRYRNVDQLDEVIRRLEGRH